MSEPAPSVKPLATVRAGAFQPPPETERWLVRSLWPANAVGLIAGTPKAYKTWLGLDFALSVASGTSCLDCFAVEQPGPVLVCLAEDSLARAHERIAGLAAHRKLALEQLRLHLITEPVVRLDRDHDVDRLFATVEALKPRLLLLDPFVRLHASNENDAREISAILARLRQLQRLHDLAIAIVHHVRKNGNRATGESLRGSGDFYAWGDTYAYMQRTQSAIRLVLEHRYEQPIEPVALRMAAADGGSGAHLELCASDDVRPELALNDAVLAALAAAATPLTRTALRAQLQVNNKRLGQALAALAEAGVIERQARGWRPRVE